MLNISCLNGVLPVNTESFYVQMLMYLQTGYENISILPKRTAANGNDTRLKITAVSNLCFLRSLTKPRELLRSADVLHYSTCSCYPRLTTKGNQNIVNSGPLSLT